MTKIPVMLRGGCILPRRERIRRSSSLMQGDPFTLIVALDDAGYAKGSVYADDGHSYMHLTGEYHYVDFEFDDAVLKSGSMNVPGWDNSAGSNEVGGRIERVIVLGYRRKVSKVVVQEEGKGKVDLTFTEVKDGYVVVKDPKVWIGTSFSLKFE